MKLNLILLLSALAMTVCSVRADELTQAAIADGDVLALSASKFVDALRASHTSAADIQAEFRYLIVSSNDAERAGYRSQRENIEFSIIAAAECAYKSGVTSEFNLWPGKDYTPEVTLTPFVETAETKPQETARTERDKKADAIRDQQEAVLRAKDIKARKKFTNGE
jgi:hypothetical protein